MRQVLRFPSEARVMVSTSPVFHRIMVGRICWELAGYFNPWTAWSLCPLRPDAIAHKKMKKEPIFIQCSIVRGRNPERSEGLFHPESLSFEAPAGLAYSRQSIQNRMLTAPFSGTVKRCARVKACSPKPVSPNYIPQRTSG